MYFSFSAPSFAGCTISGFFVNTFFSMKMAAAEKTGARAVRIRRSRRRLDHRDALLLRS